MPDVEATGTFLDGVLKWVATSEIEVTHSSDEEKDD